MKTPVFLALMFASACGGTAAAPVVYSIDPEHTYPSVEFDHMAVSTWRGKFNKTTGACRVTIYRYETRG